MTPNPTRENVIRQGRALAAAIRAFDVLEPKAGFVERWLIRLLRYSYRQRVRYLVDVLPAEVGAEIISAGDSNENND